MIVKIRDIAIAVAVLIFAIVYAVSTLQQTSYEHNKNNASLLCGRQNTNNPGGYSVCMWYWGFENVQLNYNTNVNY